MSIRTVKNDLTNETKTELRWDWIQSLIQISNFFVSEITKFRIIFELNLIRYDKYDVLVTVSSSFVIWIFVTFQLNH